MSPSVIALVTCWVMVGACFGVASTKKHPHPSPRPGSGCTDDKSCSLNGVCNSTTHKCVCDAAWSGDECQMMALLPTTKQSGLTMINVPASNSSNGTIPGNTSTWGGAVVYDPSLKRWFMWASEMKDHCGMHTWTTNSQTVRASSSKADGNYVREAVQFPIWSHEVDVVRAPTGQYVAYFSRMAQGKAPPCTSCTDGTTDPACQKVPLQANGSLGIEVSPPTYMSYSLTADPTGAWSEPVLVLLPHPMMDINAAPVILANGSVVGIWRDHNGSPKNSYSTPHPFSASNWSDPASYRWSSVPLFSVEDVKGPIEDMFLYVDGRGHFHCLFHLMYDCKNCGSHAYSVDGLRWTYTGIAYSANTTFTDGSSFEFPYCERPHLVFGVDGVTPVALTNGVKLGPQAGMANDDQSFTLLRPLKSA